MSSAIAPTMILLPSTKRPPSAMLLKIGAAGPVCTGSDTRSAARQPSAISDTPTATP